jgi:glycerophosphoryl diester phosphodiesterase
VTSAFGDTKREERLRPFRRRADRPRIIGHRGVRGDGAPLENTLAAFARAAEEGADGVELDVRLSADGELVALHDPTLERVTGGADLRAVAELRARELAAVDLGGARVATLAEALAFGRARRLTMNVEMKRDVPDRLAVARATARLLGSWDPKHPVLVSSFDPPMLFAFAAFAPEVPRALLINRTWYFEVARAARMLGFDGVHVERTVASPAFVRRLRAGGALVQVWTVNHAVEARDLDAIGVDGIISDRPAEMRASVEPENRRSAQRR